MTMADTATVPTPELDKLAKVIIYLPNHAGGC